MERRTRFVYLILIFVSILSIFVPLLLSIDDKIQNILVELSMVALITNQWC